MMCTLMSIGYLGLLNTAQAGTARIISANNAVQVKGMLLRKRWSHCASHLEAPAAHGALHKQTNLYSSSVNRRVAERCRQVAKRAQNT